MPSGDAVEGVAPGSKAHWPAATSDPMDHGLAALAAQSAGGAVAAVPELPKHYVARPRLHRRLDQAVSQAAVTVLLGPPVSGKTVLVSGWYRDPSRRVAHMAYVPLDTYDNDLPRFCGKLVGALGHVRSGCGTEALGELAASGNPRRFLDTLLSDLASLSPTVLVLDGLEVTHNPAVTTLLGDMLVELPPPVRVIVATRVDPPVRQGLLRARGELAEIDGRELAFDLTELEEFLNSFGDLGLGPGDILELYERTEGWAGGVKLAALSLGQQHDPAAFVHSFTGRNRYVADLLNLEVLEPQPSDVRHFLLTTSVLGSFDESLAGLVTGTPHVSDLLAKVERSGMFLEPLNDERTRFRYTPLFREFLQAELHRLDPVTEQEAHRAAAPEYEKQRDIGAAVGHYIEGGAAEEAVRLILKHGLRYAVTGRVDALRSWLSALPDEALTGDLDRMLEICRICLVVGMREDAVMWLQRARWRIGELDDPLLAGRHALLTGYAQLHVGNLEGAVSEGHRALTKLAEGEPSRKLRGKVSYLLAAACVGLDEFDAARRHLDEVPPGEEGVDAGNAYRGWLHYREGALEQARRYADHILELSELPWYRTAALLSRGAVHRERNRLGEAEADLTRTRELARDWARSALFVLASLELALLRVAQGRRAEAFEILAEARVHVHGLHLGHRLDALEASLWLRDGDVERSQAMRRNLPSGRLTAQLDIRLALASGDRDEALALLEDFQTVARSLQERISICLLRARALLPSDEAAARDELLWAVSLGRREGFVQVFAEDLHELEPVVRRLAAEADDLYLFNLLAAVAEPAHGAEAPFTPALVEPLSMREQIVLRYLPTSLSNQDIAEELHMSVNTLKTHLKSIYRKLGASSRVEALSAARRERLL